MFGAWGNTDHEDSIRIIDRAVEAGINFIDTADVYSAGESEVIVGKALKGLKREEIVLATKVHGAMGSDPNAQGNSRRWIIAECENSLRRLGDRLHRPLPDPPALARDRHRRHPRRPERSRTGRQDPLRRKLHFPGPPGGRGPVGGRTSGARALPDRATPVLHPGARHRGRPVAGLPAIRHGRTQLEPAGRWMALRGLRGGQGEHLQALGHAARSATTSPCR